MTSAPIWKMRIALNYTHIYLNNRGKERRLEHPVEINSLCFCKSFDLFVFLQVGFGFVLHVMIKRHDDLAWIFYPFRPNGHKFLRSQPIIIMRHTTTWSQSHKVPGFDIVIFSKDKRVPLHDYLSQSLRRMMRFEGGEDGRQSSSRYCSIQCSI